MIDECFVFMYFVFYCLWIHVALLTLYIVVYITDTMMKLEKQRDYLIYIYRVAPYCYLLHKCFIVHLFLPCVSLY